MRGGGAGLFAYQTANLLSPRQRGGGGKPPIVPLRGAEVFGEGEHPMDWAEFIGQDKAKLLLRITIGAAVARNQPCDHILLEAGKGGVGKTSLAKLAAWELGTDYWELSGQLTVEQVADAMAALGDYGVLFIDEIHRLCEGKDRGQFLLTYMQGGKLFVKGRPAPVSPKLTVIGATTEGGKLPDPLRQRFRCKPVFVDYTDPEAARIAHQLAGKLGYVEDHPLPAGTVPIPTDLGFFAEVARAANNTPRMMASVLATTRDIALTQSLVNFTGSGFDLSYTFDLLELRPDGITRQAADYLQVLLLHGTMGRQSIADTMTAPGGLTETEELLVDKGLIAKTKSGRALTDAGAMYAERLRLEAEPV